MNWNFGLGTAWHKNYTRLPFGHLREVVLIHKVLKLKLLPTFKICRLPSYGVMTMHNVIQFYPFRKSVANCGRFTRVANFTGFTVLSDTDSVSKTKHKDCFFVFFWKALWFAFNTIFILLAIISSPLTNEYRLTKNFMGTILCKLLLWHILLHQFK